MGGKTHANGVEVDLTMVGHVQDYVDVVREKANGANIVSEHWIEMGPIKGRLDSGIVLNSGEHIDIFDLKYGRKPVEVFRNKAMLIYGCGMATTATKSITLWIYQPRTIHSEGPLRKWTLTIEELMQWQAWIMQQARLAVQPGQPFTPGDHCVYCPSAQRCTALARSVYEMVEIASEVTWRDPTDAEIGAELTFLALAESILKARKKGVEAEVEARINSNKFVPGWGMETAYGTRKWIKSAAYIQMMTGVDPRDTTLVSPAELERRGAAKAVVSLLTKAPAIGNRLKAVTSQTFTKMFGKG